MATLVKKISSSALEKKLSKIPLWTCNAKKTEISRTFITPSFIHGFAFLAKIAVHAEVMKHHPDIELTTGKVKVKLSTHDIKSLSNADFELAQKIDSLKIC